jgi:predicted phage tail protein
MVVLAIVVVACFIGGVWAATYWLPQLAEGPVGSMVYFATCGLAGASLALAGLHIWSIVRELETRFGSDFGEAEIIASGLSSLLWEAGSVATLGLIAYLLAPKADGARDEPASAEGA